MVVQAGHVGAVGRPTVNVTAAAAAADADGHHELPLDGINGKPCGPLRDGVESLPLLGVGAAQRSPPPPSLPSTLLRRGSHSCAGHMVALARVVGVLFIFIVREKPSPAEKVDEFGHKLCLPVVGQ